ncbi:formate dehydrogenase subunit delta [Ancylobacter oerskovii]|uniref:Formate dehydrogenase subunit delta n=1 Tax=Ancylobacter oerskovii TaxID=459519 RepID=A0ABW4YUX9_9HYPH|nr:formate dehydrogenase subunit delta [Ancylobacter oerskovii]MBS7543574.1 formate dehydrogenase subunit delta [Ancylobacter oerskovii]
MSHDSHDSLPRLIYMANQIGAFFATQKHDKAVVGIAKHIKDFWEPRMRAKIEDHIAAGGEGLQPLVLESLKTLPPVKRADIPVPHAADSLPAHH